jgi:ubiquinone biosynthesis monooxygenase Coq7
MSSESAVFDRHLRVIHACEKGATGVYWGHRLVASVFFRDLVPQLSEMHVHEMEHFALFGSLMQRRRTRTVVLPVLWCAGGIVYGFFTALGGRKAVWKSTAVIESIVERELLQAAAFFATRDPEVHAAIRTILLDEIQHKRQGEANSPDTGKLGAVVGSAAQVGAATSKKLAERL